MHGANMKITCN